MNESAPAEPQAPVDAPGPAVAAGFGSTLAQARVRAGLSVEEAAARLRLHRRQLDALEHEDLESLPVAAYVAGFVRNYARELRIDPRPLIEDLNAKLALRGASPDSLDLGSPGATRTPMLDDRGWRHLMLAGIIGLLVCAGLIGAWMAHLRAGAGQAAAVPPPVPPPHSAAPQWAPPRAAPASGAVTLPDASGAAPTAAAVTISAPAGPASPGAATAAPAQAPAGTAAPEPIGGAAILGLLLRFNDRSWVEVSQADGRVLMSRNGEAGSMELLNTSAPLLRVVGRADAVRVEYRGQPVDLTPYVNSKGVARLMLADGRVSSGGPNNR